MKNNLATADQYAAYRDALATAKTTALQRNECSRLTSLLEAAAENRVLQIFESEKRLTFLAGLERLAGHHSFVVRHDWASVLGDSVVAGEEQRMPYDRCCFEFRMRGRTVIYTVEQEPSSSTLVGFDVFIQASSGYWVTSEEIVGAAGQFLAQQMLAICVVLDAGVATEQVVSAPAALNKKREKNHKPPINDYHVVDLAQRYRGDASVGGASSGRRVRLHFSRGHWRHYENGTKGWVKWSLKGDPDLGWVDKEYRI